MDTEVQGEPIINRLYQFDVLFYFNELGEPAFKLLIGGTEVAKVITIRTHMATLVFNLVTPGHTDISWASSFQWLDPSTRAPIIKPTNIAFIRDNDLVVSLIDSNTVQTDEGEQRMDFLFSVIQNHPHGVTMYSSNDPIIINKKPPV